MILPHEDLAVRVLDACRDRDLKIATAESCTGGLVSATLTAVPGSSDVMERGFVTYSYASKSELLDVPGDLLTAHGAVSEPVAKAMVQGALTASRADLVVAVTGVAGPGASEAKPEGLVWFAAGRRGADTRCTKVEFGALGRALVRARATEFALQLLLDIASSHSR